MTCPPGGPSLSIGHPAAERSSTLTCASKADNNDIHIISWTNVPNTWRMQYILIYIQPLHVKIFFLNPLYQFRAVKRLILLPYLRYVSGWGCPCPAGIPAISMMNAFGICPSAWWKLGWKCKKHVRTSVMHEKCELLRDGDLQTNTSVLFLVDWTVAQGWFYSLKNVCITRNTKHFFHSFISFFFTPHPYLQKTCFSGMFAASPTAVLVLWTGFYSYEVYTGEINQCE